MDTAHLCAEQASALAALDKVLEHVVESLEEENTEMCKSLLTFAFIRSQGGAPHMKRPATNQNDKG